MSGMLFRIHRMKEAPRENFRWAPHTSGTAVVKQKDYDTAGEIESLNAYSAWVELRSSERSIQTGDVLEDAAGQLFIAKYVGFEPAQWWTPEVKQSATSASETSETAAAEKL